MSTNKTDALDRFLDAQEDDYETALSEIQNGCKRSHWIWYIFPQMAGLGMSYNSEYYGIKDADEARAYLAHPVLGERLREITQALLAHKGSRTADDILGGIDALKVKSSMTLFFLVSHDPLFEEVLDAFFYGNMCETTLQMIEG